MADRQIGRHFGYNIFQMPPPTAPTRLPRLPLPRLPRLLLLLSLLAAGGRRADAAFTSQPAAVNTAPTTVTIRSTIDANDNVRCVVLANGANAPTAAEVNLGTGSGGAAAVQAPPAVSASSGSAADVSITGLVGGTEYDAYCAA